MSRKNFNHSSVEHEKKFCNLRAWSYVKRIGFKTLVLSLAVSILFPFGVVGGG